MTIQMGFLAWIIGGPVAKSVFVMTAVVTIVLLLVINSHSNNEKARTRHQLAQLHKELAQQHEFLKELSPLDSLEKCLGHIVETSAQRLRCERVSIMMPNDTNEYLYIAAACGVPQDIVAKTRIPIGESISGKVFENEAPTHIRDAKDKRGESTLPIDSAAFMSGPLMFSTMRWGKVKLGVLSVTRPSDRSDFSIDDEFVFSNLCEASAVSIYNHLAVNKVKDANVEFLETLVNAIEARDPYTRGHSDRVSKVSRAIGRKLLLSEEACKNVEIAGRLHDIGKIGMPDAILGKSGTPTDEEWEDIRCHPDVGAKMLARSSSVSEAIDAIRHHHERLDGSGYPRGLREAEIPLMARIIGVADTFDAMTTSRPYQEPLPAADAIEELKRHQNRLFDPACVDALIEIVQSGQYAEIVESIVNDNELLAAG